MKYNKKFEEKVDYIEVNKMVAEFLKHDRGPSDLLYAVAIGLGNAGYKKEANLVMLLSNKV